MPLRRRPRRSLLLAAAGLAAALVLAGCTATTIDGHGTPAAGATSSAPASAPSSGSASAGSSLTIAPASFSDCRQDLNLGGLGFPAGRLNELTFSCARINVPLDYAHPNGTTIPIQLLRIHDIHDAAPRQLLINPGGPGASGINFAIGFATEVPEDLLQHDDLLAFDPRGIGLSSPITCLTNAQKDYFNALSVNVLTTSGFDTAQNAAKTFATACSSKYGSALADYTTVNTARDMDLIRQAAGDPKMNYLGFSYGTELGYEYAQLFPNNIQAMVLDGVVDPTVAPLTSFTNQNVGFEHAFDQFAAWCVTNSPCKQLGNPRKAVYALQAQALKTPIPSASSSRVATWSLVNTGVLQALYSQSLWSTLATALLSAHKGNSAGLLSLADEYNDRYANGTYDNIAEANATISCNEQPTGPSDAVIRSTAQSWATRFPMFGLWNASSLFTCQQWQPKRTPLLKPTAHTSTKVLVLGNINDPATPYMNSQHLVSIMGNAELMSWNGEGHTSYLQGSSCVDTKVDAYLTAGTLPPPDTICQK